MTVTLAPKPAAGAAPAATGPRSCQSGSSPVVPQNPNPSLSALIQHRGTRPRLAQLLEGYDSQRKQVLPPQTEFVLVVDVDDTWLNLINECGQHDAEVLDLETGERTFADYYCYQTSVPQYQTGGRFNGKKYQVFYPPIWLNPQNSTLFQENVLVRRMVDNLKSANFSTPQSIGLVLSSRPVVPPFIAQHPNIHAAYGMRGEPFKTFFSKWAKDLCEERLGSQAEACSAAAFPLGTEKGLMLLSTIQSFATQGGRIPETDLEAQSRLQGLTVEVHDDGNVNLIAIAFLVGAFFPQVKLILTDYERTRGEVATKPRRALEVENGYLYAIRLDGKKELKAFFDPVAHVWRNRRHEEITLQTTTDPDFEEYLGLKLDCPRNEVPRESLLIPGCTLSPKPPVK